jgi:hypothetical protein
MQKAEHHSLYSTICGDLKESMTVFAIQLPMTKSEWAGTVVALLEIAAALYGIHDLPQYGCPSLTELVNMHSEGKRLVEWASFMTNHSMVLACNPDISQARDSQARGSQVLDIALAVWGFSLFR